MLPAMDPFASSLASHSSTPVVLMTQEKFIYDPLCLRAFVVQKRCTKNRTIKGASQYQPNKDVKEDLKKIYLSFPNLTSGNIISMPSFLGGTKIRIALLNILNLLFLPLRTEPLLMVHFC